MSKGSKSRVRDFKRFRENWDRVFRKDKGKYISGKEWRERQGREYEED